MTTILVWLLIATSAGGYNRGTVTNVATFKTLAHCEHVLKNIPDVGNSLGAKCIQAEILVPK